MINFPSGLFRLDDSSGKSEDERSTDSGVSDQLLQYDLKEVRVLYSGRCSTIELVENIKLNELQVIKWIPQDETYRQYRIPEERLSDSILAKSSTFEQIEHPNVKKLPKECRIIQQLKHPNIVTFIRTIMDEKRMMIGIVTEYLEKGSLGDMPESEGFSDGQIWKYFVTCLEGLDYLHRVQIVHRDINPNNLLRTTEEQIKITDFGLSEEYAEDRPLRGTTGTPQYLAPECVKEPGEPYDGKPVDVWALGMTLYWMIQRENYYEGENKYDIFEKIQREPVVVESKITTPQFLQILQQIFRTDPLLRATTTALKLKIETDKDWYNGEPSDTAQQHQ